MIVTGLDPFSPVLRESVLALGKKVPLGVLTAGEEGRSDIASNVVVGMEVCERWS